jgi:hypothetical protein
LLSSLLTRPVRAGVARVKRPTRALRIGAAAATAVVALSSAATAASAKTLYVSAKGRSRSACTVKAPCKTIGRAVKLAVAGDTVSVAHGTYREQVTIAKDITVTGAGMPMVDATGHVNGFLITGAGAAGAKVSGFMVEKANDEGILAMRTSDVTIAHNTMQGNDLGLKAKKLVGECAPQGQVPGDCGEALHLMSVTHSNVVSNTVQNNAGGILLTDELGPTAQNLISNNKSLNNVLDCGITLAGHNTNAVSSTGAPTPAVAGIYDNVVSGNTANGDGTKGLGGGILLAGGAPGTGVYDNVVSGNTANGDGLGGVTLHSHAPGQDLNGNVIVGNSLSGDGIAGNPGGTPGDVDYGITHTVGIVIASSVTPLQGTVVAGNTVSNDYYGIWTKNVPTISASANTFNGVTTPLSQN